MSDLNGGTSGFTLEIEEGVAEMPERLVVYGTQGIGKSTFASGAPNPVFIDLEGGTSKLKVARNKKPIDTWPDFLRSVDFIASHPNLPYETLVIDTLDRAEWLCTQYLCETNRDKGRPAPVTKLAEVGGGFGKGYEALYEEFRRLFGKLEQGIWRRRQMHIIILAHAKLENVKNPSGPDYQRYALKVHEKVAGMFYEAADAVLFAGKEVSVRKEGAYDEKRFRAQSDNAPFLFTKDRPHFVAKNRYNLPEKLPLSWEEFVKGVARGHSPTFIIDNIRSLAKSMPTMGGHEDTAFVQRVEEALVRVGIDAEKLITLQGWIGTQIAKRNEQIEKQLEADAMESAQHTEAQAPAQAAG
jgi:hypothetical protein